MRALYAGNDLHGNNNLVGIVDEQGKRIFKKRLPNDPQTVLEALHPFKEEIVGIAVESTYNWYWLVDGLMEGGVQGSFGQSCGDPEVFGDEAFG